MTARSNDKISIRRRFRSVNPANADMIAGHGDKDKSPQKRYVTISDHDLLDATDRMKCAGRGVENGGLPSNNK